MLEMVALRSSASIGGRSSGGHCAVVAALSCYIFGGIAFRAAFSDGFGSNGGDCVDSPIP